MKKLLFFLLLSLFSIVATAQYMPEYNVRPGDQNKCYIRNYKKGIFIHRKNKKDRLFEWDNIKTGTAILGISTIISGVIVHERTDNIIRDSDNMTFKEATDFVHKRRRIYRRLMYSGLTLTFVSIIIKF